MDLATVATGGTPVARTAVPSRFGPLDDLTHARTADRKSIVMVYTEQDNPEKYFINGKYYDPNRIDFVSRPDTVAEWTVTNDTEESTPSTSTPTSSR
ncbi:hypothetical protein [Streptomyces sp. NPDC006012]|uniref:hypothetical protein n=1 Tax=Streptomyces sp. NPDC006012 TaxID=3364739 RepID=UPI00369FDF39